MGRQQFSQKRWQLLTWDLETEKELVVKKTWTGIPDRGRHGCLAADWGKE